MFFLYVKFYFFRDVMRMIQSMPDFMTIQFALFMWWFLVLAWCAVIVYFAVFSLINMSLAKSRIQKISEQKNAALHIRRQNDIHDIVQREWRDFVQSLLEYIYVRHSWIHMDREFLVDNYQLSIDSMQHLQEVFYKSLSLDWSVQKNIHTLLLKEIARTK